MPDFKYWTAGGSRKYLVAENYPETARAAIREMRRLPDHAEAVQAFMEKRPPKFGG